MDLSELKKLLELMDATGLVELEFEEDGRRVKLRKAEPRLPASVIVPAVPVAAAPAVAPAAPAAVVPPPAPADNVAEFKSPLVGTFYRSAKPDAEPFVNVGDAVAPEKVLCIIEAMKVMNEIKAEMSGVVKEILVKNGQAVEFGETLFLIEKK